jgi:hypothetical protein
MAEAARVRPQDLQLQPALPADLGVMFAIPALTLVDLLLHPGWAVWGIALATVSFVVRQAGHVARPVLRTSLVLLALAAALSPLLPAPVTALERGVRIGGLIASLLVTVNLLSRAVARVPRARELLESLHRVPPGSRYFALSVASQFFGGLLGLAGIAMMMEAASRQKAFDERDKLSSFCAVGRGYAALSLWSPMYSNMSIVLGMYAGAHWAGVLPVAFAITLLFIVLGSALDRFSGPPSNRDPAPPAVTAGTLLRQGWPVFFGMLAFLSFMVLTSRGLGLPISAVIIAGAPMAAWLLNAHLQRPGRPACRAAATQVLQDMSSFRNMAGEVLMFLASGCAGTVIGNAIPDAWTTAIGAAVSGSPALACLTVSGGIVLMSAAAIHPMLSAVIVGASLGPVPLGLPVLAHLSAVLVGWGLAIIVTPFSVLSALASRWSGIPVLVISLRANALFVLLALGTSASLLGLLARLMRA